MHVLHYALLLLLVVGYNIASSSVLVDSTIEASKKQENYRLNDGFIPLTYDVQLTLKDNFLEKKEFTGQVEIKVKKEIEGLVIMQLHMAPEIKMNVRITIDDKEPQTMYNNITNIMSITITDTTKDEFVCKFAYTGRLYEDMYGFYISKDSNTEHIATTQFHPTFARCVFPCFDEPQFKARFTIAITVPVGYSVISNQPRITDQTGLIFTFEETPSMSTYLVAFVVSKFERYEVPLNPKASTFPMSIWSSACLKKNAAYAASVSRQIIDNLGEILGGPELAFERMGINHLDQIAIPDIAVGAMENWGLVTYRESALLFDGARPKMKDMELVATTIAHEFTHSWFGNWVTMKWFSDSWLNEGFARYFEWHGLMNMQDMKTFELDKQFVVNDVHSILETDGNFGALPLSSSVEDVNTIEEIQAKFGSITYSKGGAIIRMIQKMVGCSTFMERLKKYIINKRGNTTPKNLFDEFDDIRVDGRNVSFGEIMNSWVYESGYPVVTAFLKDGKVMVKQEHFLYNKEKTTVYKTWYVPIRLKTYTRTGPTTDSNTLNDLQFLAPTDKEKTVLENLGDDVVIINPENEGFYRVNYDNELWNRIITMLRNDHTKIDVITRAQLINDAMNLARADQLEYSTALRLLKYLEKETEYYPWYTAFSAFSNLRIRLVGETVRNDLTNTIRTLMRKFYEANKEFIVDDKKGAIAVYTKVLALEWACELEEEGECVKTAINLFNQNKGHASKVDPNLERIVYCVGLRHSTNTNEWEIMWQKYKTVVNAAEKATILTSLACTKDTTRLKYLLDQSLTDDIRNQDASSVFKAVLAGKPEGIDVAFTFLKNNFKAIPPKYGSMGGLSKAILQLSDRLTTEQQVKEFETFLNDNQDQLGEAALVGENSLQATKANLKWAVTTQSKLNAYLNP